MSYNDTCCRVKEEAIAELEKALSDAMPFVAIHVARWAEDNGGKMHETHRELLDRIGRLTGNEGLSARLERP